MIIAGGISFFAELFFRLWFYSGLRGRRSGNSDSDRGRGGNGIAIVIAVGLIAIAWFVSLLIRFALSRSREYLADAGSVELTKNPDAMILALRKIEGRGELQGATSAVMEMCVDNPREEWTDLFSTHPPIEARIKKLVDLMGGHDPGPLALPAPDDGQQTEALPDTQSGEPGSGQGPWGGAPISRRPAQALGAGPAEPPPLCRSVRSSPTGLRSILARRGGSRKAGDRRPGAFAKLAGTLRPTPSRACRGGLGGWGGGARRSR